MLCRASFVVLLLVLLRSASAQSGCIPLNVCFTIDESGSISSSDFVILTDAVIAIAQSISTFAPGSTYSAVGFSTTAESIQQPTMNLNTFVTAIDGNQQSGGNTASGSGLSLCESQIISAADPRIIVLLSDGEDNTLPFGIDRAPGIKSNGITIATVGIGSGIDPATTSLIPIASSPDLFTFVSDFSLLLQRVQEIVESLCPVPECVNIDCAKCGQVLECYANSGFEEADQAVCDAVLDESKFCTTRGGRGTACSQQCSGRQGVKCFTGASFGSCPQSIGSNPRCRGGAGGNGQRPADLSNFASYEVCVRDGGAVEVSCLNDKCEGGSSCPCAPPFEG